MSKRARVTPEIIQRVKEIKEERPELCHWEIGKKVGVCDETVRRILHNEFQIVGDKVIRIYKKPKKTEEKMERIRKLDIPIVWDDPRPEFEVAELICLNCYNRWIGVYPSTKQLKYIICDKCDVGGCVIKTGQTLPDTYIMKKGNA